MNTLPSPASRILAITAQVQLARALALVVEFGIADRIQTAPRTADELAGTLELHPGALYRLLRMLAAEGIFAEDDGGRFHHTPESMVLTTQADGSIRELVRLPWQDIIWATYLQMPHTLKTGEPAFDKAHGLPFFDFLASHPGINQLFDAAMALISAPEDAKVADAFDFGSVNRITDVGGGQGGLLAAILRRYPRVSAVLFDQAQVLAAPSGLDDGLLARCELAAGDFFQSVPTGSDAYLLKRILHDWDDAQAVTLLGNCRDALAGNSNGRVLVVEAIIKPGNEPDPIKAQDVGMMLLTEGRERTLAEYQALFQAAGLKLRQVYATQPPARVSIMEASL
jgi:hypothetical protein